LSEYVSAQSDQNHQWLAMKASKQATIRKTNQNHMPIKLFFFFLLRLSHPHDGGVFWICINCKPL